MKKNFTVLFFRRAAYMLLLCLLAGTTQAQKTIRGTVLGTKGEALNGVSVVVQGSTRGSATDASGKYAISAGEQSVLEFSIVGYVSKEVAVGGQSVIDVTLSVASANIAEVVVTALGIKRDKKSLGYSVQELSGDACQPPKKPMLPTLAGKMAGVQVTRSANGAGGSSRVIIRGPTRWLETASHCT